MRVCVCVCVCVCVIYFFVCVCFANCVCKWQWLQSARFKDKGRGDGVARHLRKICVFSEVFFPPPLPEAGIAPVPFLAPSTQCCVCGLLQEGSESEHPQSTS